MHLSYFTNIIPLTGNEYLLLKPGSKPLTVDGEVVETIKTPSCAPKEVINALIKEGFITNLKPEEEVALFYSFLEQNESQIKGKYSIAITYNCNYSAASNVTNDPTSICQFSLNFKNP